MDGSHSVRYPPPPVRPRMRRASENGDRLTYLAFIPNHCSHCGADFNAHIPSGDRHVYYCPEWALRQKWGDR